MNVYLDHAATSPVRREVLEAMLPYFCEQFGNPDSPHAVGRRAALASMTEREPVVTELQAVDDRTCAHGYAPGERKRLLRTLLHVVKLLAIILVAAKRRPVDAIFQILYIHYCSV